MLLIKSLLLVCTAAVALAAGGEYDGIVSGACWVGKEEGDRNAKGSDVFKHQRNHPRAVASIMLHSAERCEFRPREKGVMLDSHVYRNFLREVFEFPAFRNRDERKEELELNGERKQLRDRIAERYRSDVNDDRKMAEAMERLLPREMDENQGCEEGRCMWLLTHTTINSKADRREVYVEIAHIGLQLSRDEQSGKTKIERQNAHMTINSFRVDSNFLIQHADKLGDKIQTVRMNKFLEELSTHGRDNRDDDNEDDREDEELTAWLRGTKAETCGQAPNTSYRHRLYPVSQFRLGN